MNELYLVIECGHEGIEKLSFPTTDATEAKNKIIEIRKQIEELRKKCEEVLEKAGKDAQGRYIVDEHYQDAWDLMNLPKEEGGTEEITWDEWDMGKFGDPDAYCIQKWDGKEFKCCCIELDVKPSKQWLM